MPTAKEICAAIPGAELHGKNRIVKQVVSLYETKPQLGTLSWLRKGDSLPQAWHGDVLIAAERQEVPCVIRCDNPRLGLAYALQKFWSRTPAKIDNQASYVGARSVIGQQGNSVEWDGHKWVRIPPQAGVIIQKNVYIGACVTIVRGVLEDTFIREGCEICNHVNIAHGVSLGRHCLIAPFVAIGGSAKVGQRVTIWQGAQIRNGVTIGPEATIGQGANVICDVPGGETWVGNPARKKA